MTRNIFPFTPERGCPLFFGMQFSAYAHCQNSRSQIKTGRTTSHGLMRGDKLGRKRPKTDHILTPKPFRIPLPLLGLLASGSDVDPAVGPESSSGWSDTTGILAMAAWMALSHFSRNSSESRGPSHQQVVLSGGRCRHMLSSETKPSSKHSSEKARTAPFHG